ncbi:hypothetical protein RCL_jg29202.t1 [Rhizophagus clarus]|uniref:Uncharacterized protein n=1 Tax=Rhizophagus clarus TaxID=94130 RepID=A0A8H3QSI7_9GLOM|nr:hypothetical protein RCL_jg178.t1 [Rhizophagus clarus]GES90573.1 hypothetical protein RCL_jg14166.t1 [Rhizophagus clarus]GES98469.1 hypothetical protein RCL_jg29202.t1 [Rhizophagus clarus]
MYFDELEVLFLGPTFLLLILFRILIRSTGYWKLKMLDVEIINYPSIIVKLKDCERDFLHSATKTERFEVEGWNGSETIIDLCVKTAFLCALVSATVASCFQRNISMSLSKYSGDEVA